MQIYLFFCYKWQFFSDSSQLTRTRILVVVINGFVSSCFWLGWPSPHVRCAALIFEEAHLMMSTLKCTLSGEYKTRRTWWSPLFRVGLSLVWLLYENPPMLGYSQIIRRVSCVDSLKSLDEPCVCIIYSICKNGMSNPMIHSKVTKMTLYHLDLAS